MTDRTVAELRAEAAKVLNSVELGGVHLMTSVFETRFRTGGTGLMTTFSVNTKAEYHEGTLLCWVRHRVLALVTDDEGLVEIDFDEIPEHLIDENLAWRAETEWVAEYYSDDDLGEVEQSSLAAFGLLMAPPTVHPYAREHLQSLVSKGIYPAFTLPHLMPISAMPDDEVIAIEDSV